MKWIVAAALGVFMFQACQKQELESNNDSVVQEVAIEIQQEVTEAAAKSPITDPIPIGFRCVYTVTEVIGTSGTTPIGFGMNDNVCLKCTGTCVDYEGQVKINFRDVNTGLIVGWAKVKMSRDDEDCFDCPIGAWR